ncbi:RidA family protein [Conexibacter woesei]|uniref:Endoribonuclease L-PSP n=1 Tax=Conexibacter woesei (strain DSM 14684 / CCUG 47730 / CIP 108061 / JCM 11494 / NBRC 100937 / ID131577) TaxID=469383 RepID=D3F5R7_CONWI|nr:RidA family protein [Conexibacter woesei]ADB52616.1 Endoribonuclease L-PSP [Conexibacter woesei DSM 14684]
MTRTSISAPDAAPPAGPYSPGVRVGGELLFTAGQGPFDKDGRRVGETFEEQVHATLDNVEAIAKAAGATLADAVRLGVFIKDMADFPKLNAVFAERLTEPFPVRTTVPVDLPGFDVEIDAVFAVPAG